jgi:hypothetical protein
MARAKSEAVTAEQGKSDALVTLPIVGETTVEDAVFYGAIATFTAVGFVSWQAGTLIGSAHALHQRARNVMRTGVVEDLRKGLLDIADEAA